MLWYNEAGKSSKYFLNLEKSRSEARHMSSLITESGETINDQSIILRKQRDFYAKLYTSDPDVSFDYQNESGIKIPDDMKESMEGLFTMNELKTALKQLKRNKSPGVSGLTAEFYMVFFPQIKEVLLNAINYSFKTGRLHESALRGIINLIPKQGRDVRFLKHLRPISLLNTDYKLIEKMLANRIKPCLEHIINEDQKAFLSN